MTQAKGSLANFPKVSVPVITYNQVDLISETIDSIISQNYPEVEIVISDDASTDGTPDVLREYQRRFPEKVFPILNKINRGITANSNVALGACTGEFIAIIGGDDIFLPGKISEQVKAFGDPAVTLSYHPVEVFDGATGKTLYISHSRESQSPRSGLEIIQNFGVPAMSLMLRRSACPPSGFDDRLPVASDWLLSIEVGLSGKVVKLDRIYTRYRKHAGNIGNKVFSYEKDFVRTLEIVREKYAHIDGIEDACRIGKARYLLGYSFRAADTDRANAIKAIDEASELVPNKLGYKIARLVVRSALLRRLVSQLKITVKRFTS